MIYLLTWWSPYSVTILVHPHPHQHPLLIINCWPWSRWNDILKFDPGWYSASSSVSLPYLYINIWLRVMLQVPLPCHKDSEDKSVMSCSYRSSRPKPIPKLGQHWWMIHGTWMSGTTSDQRRQRRSWIAAASTEMPQKASRRSGCTSRKKDAPEGRKRGKMGKATSVTFHDFTDALMGQ